jgi:hypothetical protein
VSVPYESRFVEGDRARIASREKLQDFRDRWRLHNSLTEEQLRFAGTDVRVAEVAFYHGGDPLYRLEGIPGFWHEACLVDV